MAARKKADSPKGDGAFVVTAPLVAAKVGGRVLNFYQGDVLPSGVDESSLEHLQAVGFVTRGDVPVEAPADDESE